MEDDEHRDFKHPSWSTPTAMNDHHTLVNVHHHKQPTPLYPHEHSKLRRFSQRFSASSSSYASYSSALAAAAAAATAGTSTSTAHHQRPAAQHHHHLYHHFQPSPSEDPCNLRTRPHRHSQQRGSLTATEPRTGAAAGALGLAADSPHQQQQPHRHRRSSAVMASPKSTLAVLAKGTPAGLPPATCGALSGSTPSSPLSSPLNIRMPTSSSCSCPSPPAFSPLSPSSPTMDPAPTLSLALSSSSLSSSSSSASASTAMALCSPVLTMVSTLSQDSSPDSSASSRCSSRTSSTSPPPGRSRKASLAPLPSHHHHHFYQPQRKPLLGSRSGSLAEPGPLSSAPVESSAVVERLCTSILSSCSPSLSSATPLPPSELKKSRRCSGQGHAPTASTSTTRSSISSGSSVSSSSSNNNRQHHRLSTATSLPHSSSSSMSSMRKNAAQSTSSSAQIARTAHSRQHSQRRKRQQHSPLQHPNTSPQAIAQNSTKYIRFLFWPLLPLLILAIGGQSSAWFESPERNGSSTAHPRHHAGFVGHVRARKQPSGTLEGVPYQFGFEAGSCESWSVVGKTDQLCKQSSLMTVWSTPIMDTLSCPLLPPECSPSPRRSRQECIIQEQHLQPQVHVLQDEAAKASIISSPVQPAYERLVPELHQPWDRESCGCAISGSRFLLLLSWDMFKPGFSWRQRSFAVGCRDGSRGEEHDDDIEANRAISVSSLMTAWVDMVEQVLGSIYEVSLWRHQRGLGSLKQNRGRAGATVEATAAADSTTQQQERHKPGRYIFRIAFVLGLVLLAMAIHETFFAKVELPSYTRA